MGPPTGPKKQMVDGRLTVYKQLRLMHGDKVRSKYVKKGDGTPWDSDSPLSWSPACQVQSWGRWGTVIGTVSSVQRGMEVTIDFDPKPLRRGTNQIVLPFSLKEYASVVQTTGPTTHDDETFFQTRQIMHMHNGRVAPNPPVEHIRKIFWTGSYRRYHKIGYVIAYDIVSPHYDSEE